MTSESGAAGAGHRRCLHHEVVNQTDFKLLSRKIPRTESRVKGLFLVFTSTRVQQSALAPLQQFGLSVAPNSRVSNVPPVFKLQQRATLNDYKPGSM